MPTTVYVNGQNIAEPGAYSEIDASELVAPAFGATGVVAVLGTSIGGRPYSEIADPLNDFQVAKTSGQVRKLFREGNLRELGAIMFRPARDPAIPSGAQKVVFVKVNPSTQASVTLTNGDGDALVVSSRDYGAFTNQTRVTVATATSGTGKKVTVTLEDRTEIFDELGAVGKATITYAGGSDGASTALVSVTATALVVAFTRADAGLDSQFTQAGAAASLEVLSASAGDTTQTFTVSGLNASNVPTSVSVTLNGTNVVAITGTWNLTTAVTLSAVSAGTVTLRIASGGATVATMTAGQTSRGRAALDIPVTGTLTIVADGATTRQAVLRGRNAAGTAIAERLVLTGTSPVTITGAFAHFTALEVGNVEAARTVTLAGNMVNALFTNYTTLKQLEDHIEAKSADFTVVPLIGSPTRFDPVNLDHRTATSIMDPTVVTLYGQLYDIVTALNQKSALVEAEEATGATGAPSNVGPVMLTGAHEGDVGNPGVPTATNDDWVAAIEKLKQIRVNTLVPATSDDAIHAAVVDHCEYMCGIGRSERDCVLAADVDETFAQIKARALALNSRHARLCSQEVYLFNTALEPEWQPPMFQAALIAAAQAGCSVGTPLTKKLFNVNGVRQHSSWNPADDASEAILAGLTFMRFVDGRGTILVRNNTTYLVDENVVFSEASANQALNTAVFEFRNRMEAAVGKKGFGGTIRDAKAKGIAILDAMKNDTDPFLVDYVAPSFTLVKDTLECEVGMAPVLPINFVPIKVSVYAPTLTA